MTKLPTINLKGKEYVQVKDRVIYFNDTYPQGQIKTNVKFELDGKSVCFNAVVTPDIGTDRHFTGHAFGTIDEVKAFEKLETVAVGRALALMGIGVLESVSSADEIDRFHKKTEPAQQPTTKSSQNILEFNQSKEKPDFPPFPLPSKKSWEKEQILKIAQYPFRLKKGVSRAGKKYTMLEDWTGQAGFIPEATYDYLKDQYNDESYFNTSKEDRATYGQHLNDIKSD